MITVTGASKNYGSFAALDDVTLDIPAGTLTALLGPSRAVRVPAGISSETSSRAVKVP